MNSEEIRVGVLLRKEWFFQQPQRVRGCKLGGQKTGPESGIWEVTIPQWEFQLNDEIRSRKGRAGSKVLFVRFVF